jgi:hypothetical protein
MSVRLPTVHQRTPTQSRCYILDNIHGGLTRGALALGESPPACAWRFPLHARSPNHGGLTPAALASECERLPAKLRLLRCTNAHAPGAGGVSPPWFAEPHRQGSATFAMHERTCIRSGGRQPPVARGNTLARASRQYRCDCRPCISGPRRSRGATSSTTSTAGSRPPLLSPANRCLLVRGDFPCTRVLLTTAGSRRPLLRRNANVCRRNCDFCDARTHVHQERGASAPRGSRNRTGKGVPLLRCTNACAPGAGGVSPPWLAKPHVQWRGAIVRGTSDPHTGERQRSYGTHHTHGGLTPAALVSGESLPACAWRFLLHARSPNHGGLTPAALVSECERLPAKLPLLRWTNACAPRAGGVSPPWLAEPHVQVRSRHGQRDCRPCISGLRCSRGATSSTTFTAG